MIRKFISHGEKIIGALALSLFLLSPFYPTLLVYADEIEEVQEIEESEVSQDDDTGVDMATETDTEENVEETTEEDVSQNVQINIVSDNAEVSEETDEDGNVIKYIINATPTSEESETQSVDLSLIEQKLDSLIEVVYAIAFILGGLVIYLFIHWALNRKGVLG